jgi:sigma-B regulation protein RsbU (phosphoserine phosphatase)
MKILIAEDDAVSRRLLERKLVMWGYQVVICQNGTEAWEWLQRDDSPSLAILNWMMPGMDGVQICRQVRDLKRKSYVYIILLTARDQKEDIVEGIEAGADDYVTKPFNPHELNVRIRAGRRVLEMETELLQREKLRGVVEMAGATCHEFNQPMQVISGYAELLMKEVAPSSPVHAKIEKIKEATEVMAQITGKLQQITRYETREYYDGMRIIDIDKASRLAAEGAEREKPSAENKAEEPQGTTQETTQETAAPPVCGWR